jgi:hypothetical protein
VAAVAFAGTQVNAIFQQYRRGTRGRDLIARKCSLFMPASRLPRCRRDVGLDDPPRK